MLGEAVVGNDEVRRHIQRVVVGVVVVQTLLGTIDVDAFQRSVALDDTGARVVVGVARGVAGIRQNHQAVLLVPRHRAHRIPVGDGADGLVEI